jgi:tellurite resistance protein
MGLFDGFKNKSDTLNQKHAFIASLIYMIAADGVVEDEEIMQLLGAIAQFPDRDEVFNTAVKYTKRTPPSQFLAETNGLLSDAQKMTILVNLADSLTSDGDADPSEQRLFEQFMQAWGISEDRFGPFFEVIVMKNDRTVFINQNDSRNAAGHRVSLSKG